MIKVGLNVTGADELAANLRALGDAVRRRALLAVLRAAAIPIQGRMIELAPINPSLGRHIKDNIGIQSVTRIGSVAGEEWDATDEFQAAVAIGPTKDYFYGYFLEYGTVRHSPQPFGRPAFDGQSDRSLTVIRQGLWALIADAAAKRGAFKDRS